MIYDVAIVGAGIVGQVAMDELIDAKLNVAIIDNFKANAENRFLRDIDGNDLVWAKGSRIAGYPGGRLIWGGNCSFTTIKDHSPFNSDIHEALPSYARRLRKHGFPRLKHSELGLSQSDKFFVRDFSNFSENDWLSRIKSVRKASVISGMVNKIIQNSDQTLDLYITHTNFVDQIIKAKKIIVCAGPFGTQELLDKSNLIPNAMPYIFDHLSLEIGSLSFRKIRLASFGLFGWNRYSSLNLKTCYSIFEESSNTLWTLRLFPKNLIGIKNLSKVILANFRKLKLRKSFSLLTKLILSILTGRVLHTEIAIQVSIDFLDEKNFIKSASYGERSKIDFMEYEDLDLTFSNKVQDFISEIISKHVESKFDFNIKDFISFDLSTAQTASHHMGTVCRALKVSDTSSLEINKNIWVAGSSVFQRTVPGHPTMLSAATALIAVDDILTRLGE